MESLPGIRLMFVAPLFFFKLLVVVYKGMLNLAVFWRDFEWAASFPRFTWPKTTLQLGTEHGLTSEFGMGSGGTRAL